MTAPAQTPVIQDPAAAGEFGPRPRIADLEGRVVLIQPTSLDVVPNALKPGETQKRLTLDVIVMDGGPLEMGANSTNRTPATHRVATPYRATGVLSSHVNIISQVKDALPGPANQGRGGLVLGTIQRGKTDKPGNNPPWNVVALEPGDPRRALASQVFQAVMTGEFINPEPEQIGGAVAAVAPGTAMSYEAFLAMQAAQATPAPVADVPPAGWPAEVWATLSAEQKAGVRGAATPVQGGGGTTPF